MKRLHLLILLTLFAALCRSQSSRFEIRFSEPAAIYIYLEHLASKDPDNAFKKQFAGSVYNRDKYKSLIQQFDTLRINYIYEFPGFPYGSKMPGMTRSLLKKHLVGSANLKEFKKKAAGLIPNVDLLQLSTILYEFQLVYRELVYQPNKQKFEKQLAEISEFAKKKNLNACFDKGLAFYRSYWDDSFPFEIAFYPFPNGEGLTAEAFCNVATSALPTGTKDYSSILGIMMHEVFHILYDEQTQQVKKNIAKWFNNNPSKSSAYAYLLFNEVLATSLGNGFVYETLEGTKDEGDWYDRKYINLMARKIYPMLQDYLIQKKSIDEGFVNIYIKFYEDNYSEWLNEMDNLMCYRYVVTDNMADFLMLRKFYPYCSLFQHEDQVTEGAIARLKATPITKLLIVSKDNEAKLELIQKSFPELADWKYKAKQDFFYSLFLQDKTQLIIINAVKNTPEQLISGRITLPPKEPVKK